MFQFKFCIFDKISAGINMDNFIYIDKTALQIFL